MQDLLTKLNPEQRKAVVTTDGPLLILAGAGSGKTRVLTHRIAYIISEKGVLPRNILAVTFTNKAAGEMKERVKHILGAVGDRVWVSTFHSACVRILRKNITKLGYGENFVIYDDREQLGVIKGAMAALNINEKLFAPKAIAGRIDQAKNHLLNSASYAAMAKDFFSERAARVYAAYEEEMRKNNALDFNDLIMLTVRLLNERPDILKSYQDQLRYIMVDEYQDTNHAQYKLIKMLASGLRNLCVVGDDDQSIYAWRGADISNILDFEKDYRDAVVIRLEQNYRSTKNIIKAAGEVVRRNTGRKGKTLWTDNPEGEPISYYSARDEHDEAGFVTREVEKLRQESGVRSRESKGQNSELPTPNSQLMYRDFAVFYRTNAQSRVMEDRLMRDGIPYTIVGGMRFYDRAEIKDILAYLKVIANPSDAIGLKRIINVPHRGIGDATVEKVEAYAAGKGITLYEAIGEVAEKFPSVPSLSKGDEGGLSKGPRLKLKSFYEMMERLKKGEGTVPSPPAPLPVGEGGRRPGEGVVESGLSPVNAKFGVARLVQLILDETGYIQKLKEEKTEEALGRIENLEEFITAAEEFDEKAEEKTLRSFLDQVALVSDVDEYEGATDRVTLMTLHAAKGLEFPVVFIIGMEDGLFPHSRTKYDPEGVEEERRLCYVGMTRAQQKLYLLNARERRVFGREQINSPSLFLSEIPATLLERVGAGKNIAECRMRNADFKSEIRNPKSEIQAGSNQAMEGFFKGRTVCFDKLSMNGTTVRPELVEGHNGSSFKTGARVRHGTLGVGVVKGTEGGGDMEKVTVQFQTGTKKLMARFAGLEVI
ncbi:MAG: UvrD-helicase domain-containing protein [Deltaproteobacteria bacterium]|nr:UvrD-helicase domain-containing protein [Deltaproteobacteria bacterium]